MDWIQEEWSWNKVAFKDTWFTRTLYCVFIQNIVSYVYTAHVLQVTPRKRVTHKILEITYINKWLRFVSTISDSNG